MIRRLLLGAIVLASSCGNDDANERSLFLKRIRDYNGAQQVDQPRMLEAIRRLAPESDAVREAQGVCLAAFDGMARAESEHARAQSLLQEVESGTRTLDGTQDEIRRAIGASNAAVTGARTAIDRCTRLVDGLRLGRE